MRWDICLEIPDGYRVIKKERTVDIATAGAWMSTKRQHRYTSARRQGDEAVVTRHVVSCPHCGHEVPAYPRFLGKGVPAERVPRTVVEQWASDQMTLYDVVDRHLRFNRVVRPGAVYLCPRCGKSSRAGTRPTMLYIRGEEGRISLSVDRGGLRGLLELPDNGEDGELTLPIGETVTFDLDRGKVVLTAADANGREAAFYDAAEEPVLWERSAVYAVLARSAMARRKLRAVFADLYGSPLPFERSETGPNEFVDMTAFRGFSREFYEAVPYEPGTHRVDRSFREAAAALQDASALPALYDASGLPGSKAIRRRFFRDQGLFFYLKEAKLLWDMVEEPNAFRRLLDLGHFYEVLAYLHRYPGTEVFFRDYRRERGVNRLVGRICGRWRDVRSAALCYVSLSPADRETERAGWSRRRHDLLVEYGPAYSLPLPTGCGRAKDCTVDGYSFTWLRSRRAYQAAGKALNNCLGDWSSGSNPVIVVKKGSECRAAIEMMENDVMQIRGPNNDSIAGDEELQKTVRKWAEKFRLRMPPAFLFEDVELCF